MCAHSSTLKACVAAEGRHDVVSFPPSSPSFLFIPLPSLPLLSSLPLHSATSPLLALSPSPRVAVGPFSPVPHCSLFTPPPCAACRWRRGMQIAGVHGRDPKNPFLLCSRHERLCCHIRSVPPHRPLFFGFASSCPLFPPIICFHSLRLSPPLAISYHPHSFIILFPPFVSAREIHSFCISFDCLSVVSLPASLIVPLPPSVC